MLEKLCRRTSIFSDGILSDEGVFRASILHPVGGSRAILTFLTAKSKDILGTRSLYEQNYIQPKNQDKNIIVTKERMIEYLEPSSCQ